MKQWWLKLQTRERRTVLIGAGVLLAMCLYLFAWQPLLNERARLLESVQLLQGDQQWMRQAAAQLRQLRGSGASTEKYTSLLGVINSTARPVLKDAIVKRVEEDRTTGVRVWIDEVAFDDLVLWLGDLQRRYGVMLTSLAAERTGKQGRVNARLTLQEGR